MESMQRGVEETVVSVWYRLINMYPNRWPRCS